MARSLEHLQSMRSQLENIHERLARFEVASEAPVKAEADQDASDTTRASGRRSLDGSNDGEWESSKLYSGIPGLPIFREEVRNDIEQIQRFLEKYTLHLTTVSPAAFCTDAPYLIALWCELDRAPRPIVAFDQAFPIPSEKKNGSKPVSPSVTFSRKSLFGAKVDIVADGGRQWIRVNTIENARLLAEFRELDSYLNGSSEEEEDGDDGDGCDHVHACVDRLSISSSSNASTKKQTPSPDELDNSLLQIGKALRSAAEASAANLAENESASPAPKVTLRFTHLVLDTASLDELEKDGLKIVGSRSRCVTSNSAEIDARIAQTLHELLGMGLEVVLGAYDFRRQPDSDS